MSADKSTVTLIYRKTGLAAPLFVAGSFTNPAWECQEMHSVANEAGEHRFTVQVPVEPGKEYRYRFRVSGDDSWFVDERRSTALNSLGQNCNTLRVPVTIKTGDELYLYPVEAEQNNSLAAADESQATLNSESASIPTNKSLNTAKEGVPRSGTPIKQVAAVAAEVADTAANLDGPSLEPSSLMAFRNDVHTDPAIEEQIDPPLFAHESFGNYEFIEHEIDQNDDMETGQRSSSLLSNGGGSVGDIVDDVDIDDPTLEKFPSDKESVLDTLRKIQSSTEGRRVSQDEGQHSALAVSMRTSIDSSEEYDFSSSPSSRQREDRISRSSFGRPRSAASLGCIAEEPKTGEDASSSLKDGKRDESQTASSNASGTNSTDAGGSLAVNTVKA
ncbi:hypothetical protein E4U19_004394 [Claviceps sp. Clav32 group G5]|nr:hypothetical protein E4U40_002269 [Claviceps sp. LM458 group G5]KAG6035696.1 hypothetical protein E4U19_004394 [Claviceps sp. Clav32 group G5]KAG6050300.1 hypothetical protein E4U39_004428 [Claviceps sp. Clav50 group G5]